MDAGHALVVMVQKRLHEVHRQTAGLRDSRPDLRRSWDVKAGRAIAGRTVAGDRRGPRAFSSEVGTGSREENALKQKTRAPFRFNRNGKGSRDPLSSPAQKEPVRRQFR